MNYSITAAVARCLETLHSPWYGLNDEDGLPTNRFFYIHSRLCIKTQYISPFGFTYLFKTGLSISIVSLTTIRLLKDNRLSQFDSKSPEEQKHNI